MAVVVMPAAPAEGSSMPDWMVERCIGSIVHSHNHIDVEQLAADLEIDLRDAWDVVVEAMYCLPRAVDIYSRAGAH